MIEAVLRTSDGTTVELDVDRWHAEANDTEINAMLRGDGPFLDVGCGPGRLIAYLAERGVPSLGVEPSPAASAEARRRGGSVLNRSVFAALPGTGRWGTALLFDGNIGIGGDPVALLVRCAELVRPTGWVIAEVDAPGMPSRSFEAQLETGDHVSAWFRWSTLSADDAARTGIAAGLTVDEIWEEDNRWFAAWRRPVPSRT